MELLQYDHGLPGQDQTAPRPASPDRPSSTVELLFVRHTPRIYNLALRLLGNAADAEAVTQEILLRLVRKIDHFPAGADPTGWLRRVVVDAVLLYRRPRADCVGRLAGRRPRLALHDPAHVPDGNSPAGAPGGARADEASARLFEEAIARLPDLYRHVYVLADVEGCTRASVGELLGVSPTTVKCRLGRARLLMRGLLAPVGVGPSA